jgi:NAD(P)H-dependent flavin oxidoreductase YrpB (nitropropane dioxygenase family)
MLAAWAYWGGRGQQDWLEVTNLEEGRQALDPGADIVVAQGSEAGGHGGGRATLPSSRPSVP